MNYLFLNKHNPSQQKYVLRHKYAKENNQNLLFKMECMFRTNKGYAYLVSYCAKEKGRKTMHNKRLRSALNYFTIFFNQIGNQSLNFN